ncbi:hypothetical protein [Nostoc sp. FACHB-190]|uniref:hypothetical protein n=1 Tax=Nostoc sp. FACHB-190 TaxID=2692838 RepID=UPI0016860021|nr:hypothetical protein [Nostoc sp. FACHB-190]
MGNNILYWQKFGLVFVSFGKITENCGNAIANLPHLKPKQPKFSAKIGKIFFPDKKTQQKQKLYINIKKYFILYSTNLSALDVKNIYLSLAQPIDV